VEDSFEQNSEKRKAKKETRRKERKLDRHYPVIEHAPQAHILVHLQALALYVLADETAPQWVPVQSRKSINQVVVLMVPGLELGMFSGKIPLNFAVQLRRKFYIFWMKE
jgi:RNA exonuclease 1